jgi:hypothetical protein
MEKEAGKRACVRVESCVDELRMLTYADAC